MAILTVRVSAKRSGQDCIYKNKINLEDPNMIALMLKDLQEQCNAPIHKACLLLVNKPKLFPF